MNTPEENPEPESICQEAHRIQEDNRQQEYGHPLTNFSDIAHIWDAYVYSAHGVEGFFKPEDVANMMILMKIVRNNLRPKRDNAVDIAGYAQCLGKIQDL